MMPVKVVVVGAGSMAREHIKAFRSLPDVEVVGIHSRTKSRAEEVAAEFAISVVADSIASLKIATGADLAVVAVPELAANAVSKQCFEQDWAVLLEKPAGYDLDDAKDISSAAGKSKYPIMIGFNRRFYSSTMTILDDLRERDGHRYVHVQDQQSFAEARRYNHPERVVEKFMYANSIHVIDLIATFCRGKVATVTPIMPWRGEGTEIVLAHIAFDSGDTALYEGIWQGPGPWTCTVNTPTRRWVMQPLEKAAYQDVGERRQTIIEPTDDDVKYKPGFLRQAEAVVKRLRGGASRAVDVNDSMATMHLIHRIFGV